MEGMGTITYGFAQINVELMTQQITVDLRHCETFIAGAYDDGHSWNGDFTISACIVCHKKSENAKMLLY